MDIAALLRLTTATTASLLLSACSGAGSNETTQPTEVPQPMVASDAIISKVYDPDYMLPKGFFVDERTNTPQSYTVYHVKDASLSYELCTNEFDTARAWEEADNQSRAVSGHFVGTYENDQYFEFIRELSYPGDIGNVPGATSPGFARVFRCASVNRNGVDRNLRYGFGGQLNMQPLEAADVTRFAEYLWQFTFFDNPKRKVLDSFVTEDSQSIEHTMRLAFVVNQGFERCDKIEIIDWTFKVQRTTGNIERQFQPVDVFEARVVNGSPERC